MRFGFRISVILISCCTLINQGCTPERAANEARSDAKDASKDADKILEPVVVAEPVGPVVVPVDPFTPPPPPGGGGGGSQGAIKPARTGNPDATGRGATCGNGIQEARSQGSCPYPIYGTRIGEGESFLLGFSFSGAQEFSQLITAAVGTKCTDFGGLTSVDFSPDGVLYAYGRAICDGIKNNYLFTLDCQTAKATLVGDLPIAAKSNLLPSLPYVLDIDFDSHGKLYAYFSGSPNSLAFINILTGVVTTIGSTGLTDQPAGLASLNFPDPDFLFQASSTLDRLDVIDGFSTPYGNIIFPAGADPALFSMDADPSTKIIYVSFNVGGATYLGTLDNDTNTVNFLGAGLALAKGFYGVAVNRIYEECDGAAFELPAGTSCSARCDLIETNCADFVTIPGKFETIEEIDNDNNGLANCADPACVNQACNDLNGCSINTVCSDPSIFKLPVNCEINADCGQAGSCNNGRCECATDTQCPSGATCNDGLCLQVGQITCTDGDCPKGAECENGHCLGRSQCVGTDLSEVPVAEGGCLDGNECTRDLCESVKLAPFDQFACVYNLDTELTDFGSCTPAGNCSLPLNPDGTCPAGGQKDLCLAGACATGPAVPFACEDDKQCSGVVAGDCVEGGTCACKTSDYCPTGTTCLGNTCVTVEAPSCVGAGLGVVPVAEGGCEDGNPCTTDDCIEADVDGVLSPICSNGAIDNPLVACSAEDNTCVTGSCIAGACDFSAGEGKPNECLFDQDCALLSVCVNAVLGRCEADTLEIPGKCLTDLDCSILGLGICVLPEGGIQAGQCSCDDGNACTFDDICTDGVCGGKAVPDGKPCDASGVACILEECNKEGECVQVGIDPKVCGPATICAAPQCTEEGCVLDVTVGPVLCKTEPVDGICYPGLAACPSTICEPIVGAEPVFCPAQ